MKKKLFGMIACLAFVFALLPMSVNAETISSVTINGLEYPIGGKKLDTSYTLPQTDISYTKDTSVGDGVTWYEQGLNMGDVSDNKGTEIKDIATYTVKNNCYYMAKINLCDVKYLNNSVESYSYFEDPVSVTYEVPNRLKNSTVLVSNAESQATVYLFFKSDSLFGYNNGGAISVNTDKVSNEFDLNTDGDAYNDAFKVAAGTYPWRASDMSWNNELYNISLTWYKGIGNNKTEMEQSAVFESGEKYTLRVTADSDIADSNVTFNTEDEFLLAYINNAYGETVQRSQLKFVADFVCVSQASVEEIVISNIQLPHEYATIQTTGFSVTSGVTISDSTWYKDYNLEVPKEVTGKFEPATDYWLKLMLQLQDGYIVDFENFDEKDIEVNCGIIYECKKNLDGSILVTIKFEIPEHKCNPGSAWEKDATNHWKVCACGEKKETAVHTYDAGVVTKAATESATGVKTYTCSVCGYTKTEAIPMLEKKEEPKEEAKLPAKNDIIKDASGVSYKVTKAGASGGTVEYKAPKNKKVKKVTIPATVKINGVSYKVTAIAKNAFKGCSKLTNVTIGKNVTKIGAKAFYGCKKLKNITIKTTKLTSKSVGSKAFSGTPKNARVKVPKKSLKAYKKFLYKKGVHKKAKIGK